MEIAVFSENVKIMLEREGELRLEKMHLEDSELQLRCTIRFRKEENLTTTNEAKIWLDEVREVLSEVEKFQYDCRRGDGCHLDRLMPDQHGCHFDRLLEDLRRLTAERKDLTVFVPAPPDPVVPSPAIGVENILSEICGFVEDEGSRIMGLYGMGGVGKTTLLIAIYYHFSGKRSGRFDLVIPVVVSHHVDIVLIQKKIFTRLGYSDEKVPAYREERTTKLRKKLVKMKFLLLLDDVWERLDLEEIGIPLSVKGSKMVFTTRSKEVFTVMKAAHQVKVRCLTPESSWMLFRQRVGENIDKLDPSTSSLARKVAEKCGGLPLALVTVGEAMAEALTWREWDAALKTLKSAGALAFEYAQEVIGLGKVRTSLKLSYDRLNDRCHQECLLFFSLFPEDCVIQVDELIMRGLSICRRLCSVIRFLEMTNLESFSTSNFFNVLGASKELRKLSIINCRKTSFTLDLRDQQIFRNLQDSKIVQCNAMEKIWITKLPCLRSLQVEECPKMVEIILVEESKMSNEDPEKDSFLPSLMEISLITMQNLKSICSLPLLLPSLKKVCVRNCPELEKLSFELKSATRLLDLQLIGCNNMAEMIGVGDRDEAYDVGLNFRVLIGSSLQH